MHYHRCEIVRVNIGNNETNKNKLLGIVLNSKLYFTDHINNFCKKEY